MLKGVEKQVVVLKNTDSKLFEQAIFILKDKNQVCEKDLLSECEKIIKNNMIKKTPIIKSKKNKYIRICIVALISLLSLSFAILVINLL